MAFQHSLLGSPFAIRNPVSRFIPPGLGWIPDLPDPRDYSADHSLVQRILRRLRRFRDQKLPRRVDLREDGDGVYFSPVQDQGPLNCSPTFACLSLVEYFERRALGHVFDPSHLFLYKISRKLRGLRGDSGIDLRSTFKALARYGTPPADFWPYKHTTFDDEPSDISLLGFSREFAKLIYVRLDGPKNTGSEVLQAVKSFLEAGFPVAFGFSVPHSLSADAEIPYRPNYDSIRGGQAVLAVGYDDDHLPLNSGALLVRCSWGESWGMKGHGWIPYSYVKQGLGLDFWTLLKPDWLAKSLFKNPVPSCSGCVPSRTPRRL